MGKYQKSTYFKKESKEKYDKLSEEGKERVNKAMRTYLVKVVQAVSDDDKRSNQNGTSQSLPSTDQLSPE